ncbi:MAG TPA: hypothetical protein VNO86_11280, partial [Candidatus Binatia bacterium]|nr:hypothetical protein [Candidatus Binatia bacterium]
MDASRAPDARSAFTGGTLPPEGARERPPELANGELPGRDSRFDGLHAEAKAAIGYSANSVRAIRERYREAYLEELARWHTLRDELERLERAGRPSRPAEGVDPATAAEAGADDARLRELRREVALLTSSLGVHQQELAKLELAQQALERTWVFLER